MNCHNQIIYILTMTINSISFFLFFVAVFILYYIPMLRSKGQNCILLLASLFFYGYADLRMLLLLVLSMLVFWLLGRGISGQCCNRWKNTLMTCGVVLGVSLLLYFKYLNFFILSFAGLLSLIGMQTNYEAFNIIMPLGISFFTFRLISYLVDLRKQEIHSVSLLDFSTYVCFFPTILSGPIDRSTTFLPQLRTRRCFDGVLAIEGCRQILWGMFKKMVVADGLSLFVCRDVGASNGSTLAIVAVMYSIQIYADFSGYSDMAIGVGKLLGIRITRNFHYPYFSRSVAEFWNRWHISLLSWFRYYIYIPLGGSRCSTMKVIRNTFIIFLVSGLWHGANWTFMVWGLFHAVLFLPLLLNKNRKRHKQDTPYNFRDIVNILFVFLLITVGWIIFRCNDLTEVWLYIRTMCSPSLLDRPEGVIWALPSVIFAVIMFSLEWSKRKTEFPLADMTVNVFWRWGIYVFLILSIVYYQGKSTDFIYFKF